jgi:Arc/MetJ family transcription regulator
MLLNVKFPHDEFNKAVRDGTVGQKIGRILEDAKPEAVYFTDQDGQRSAILVINMVDPSQIPAFAEP